MSPIVPLLKRTLRPSQHSKRVLIRWNSACSPRPQYRYLVPTPSIPPALSNPAPVHYITTTPREIAVSFVATSTSKRVLVAARSFSTSPGSNFGPGHPTASSSSPVDPTSCNDTANFAKKRPRARQNVCSSPPRSFSTSPGSNFGPGHPTSIVILSR